MALHSFDPEIAEIVGVNAATIYQNIVYWVEKNQANDKHLYDGQYWTYNSIKAFGEQFPYLSAKQIKTALNKLIDQGFIVKGDYNKANFDKTCWYGIAQKGQSIIPQGPMEGTNRANGLAPEGQPIPDSKPNIKPDSKLARDAQPAKSTPRSELEKVLSADMAKVVIEHRKAIRKPLSTFAAKLIADQLAKISDPNDGARMMIERAWQGFNADWYFNAKAGSSKSKSLAGVFGQLADQMEGGNS